MKKIKIGISQINNSFSGANYLPYAAGLIESYFLKYSKNPKKFKFALPLFKRISVEDAVKQFMNLDIVGFSVYSWNEQLSLAIARELKKHNKNITIIFGGPQVPDYSKRYLLKNKFIDFTVHGEGEKVFLDLVESIECKSFSSVGGISWLDGDHFFSTPKITRIKELEEIPSPYLDGVFDKLMEKFPENEWLILWETNRGCPFKCTFCDWGSATADKVNKFEVDRLKAEIDWFSKKKIEFIFCCDANFGILKRDVEIAEYASFVKRTTGYPKALSVQNTKNATERAYLTQKILADSGLNKGVTLSMQSLDKETLENIKRDNISLNTYEQLQKRFTVDGVPTYSDLILALPGETYDSFTNGISTLIENGQHNRIQFNNLSILPNSEMGDKVYQKKYGMKLVETNILNMHGSYQGDDFGVPEKQELVIATAAMPKDDWVKVRAISWMTAFLHFNKLLQIPIIVFQHISGLDYKKIIELFFNADEKKFPILFKIKKHFLKAAKIIQKGGPEYMFSEKWLSIWWPHDEFMFIKLFEEKLIEKFYEESKQIFYNNLDIINKRHSRMEIAITESINVNFEMLKLPNRNSNVELNLSFNILDFYNSVLKGKFIDLKDGKFSYFVERKKDIWSDDQDWAKKVVWYANKKGAYLYGSKALKKYYSAHY